MNRLRNLQREQLDAQYERLQPLFLVQNPPGGWLRSIREALGMRLSQAGDRMGITRQSFSELEKREKEGSISMQKLAETAQALDCKLVYAIIPKEGSLESLVERRVRELAKEIVMRASTTMELEAQANPPKRLARALEDQISLLREEMPKKLWD